MDRLGKTNITPLLDDIHLLMLSYSFYNEISTLMSIEPLIPEHDTLVDTTNSTTFWPASIDGSRAFNREAKTCTSIQTCALPLTQRSHSNSIPSTNGAGPSAVDSQQWTKGFSSANTEEQPLWIQACELGTMIDGSVTSVSPTESKKTRRARHAANQRHKKARKACKEKFKDQSSGKAATGAAEREQQRREMNKVAAAKCRLRQRKQVQTIQEKAS